MILFFNPPEFFPPLDFFYGIVNSDIWIALDHLPYVSRSRHSRCRVRSSNGGVAILPAAVVHPCNKSLCEAVINNLYPWRRTFLRSIVEYYVDTPYFEEVYGELESYIQSPHVLLASLNIETIHWASELLGKKLNCIRTSQFYTKEDSREKVTDFILKSMSAESFNGSYTQQYYPQHREPFEKGLSILDSLFCIGPEDTRKLLCPPI